MTIDALLGAGLVEFLVVILLYMFILWTGVLLKQHDIYITARSK